MKITIEIEYLWIQYVGEDMVFCSSLVAVGISLAVSDLYDRGTHWMEHRGRKLGFRIRSIG
jgi:hypothetical protein